MILDWLRARLLGNLRPCCPRCKAQDLIPRFMITRTTAGRPWKQKPVGTRGFCNSCGLDYSITIDGIYSHGLAVESPPPAPGDPNQKLGGLVGDEFMPSYRGV